MKTPYDRKLEYLEKRLAFQFEVRLNNFKQEIIDNFRNFRDEFFTKIDPILKEVIASREERSIITYQILQLRNKVDEFIKK